MTLQQCLRGLSEGALRVVAANLGIVSSGSRTKLARKVHRHLTDPKGVAALVEPLPSPAFQLLMALAGAGSGGVSLGELAVSAAHWLGPAEAAPSTHAGLLARGLAFGVSSGDELRLEVPEDLQAPVLEAGAERLARHLPRAEISAEIPRIWGDAALHDIVALLACVRREAVKVTQKGFPSKRHANAMALAIRRPDVPRAVRAAPPGDPCSPRLRTLLDYGHSRRLIAEGEGRLTLTQAIKTWLAAPVEALRADAAHFILALGGELPAPAVQLAYRILRHRSRRASVTVKALARTCLEHAFLGAGSAEGKCSAKAVNEALVRLCWFGLAQGFVRDDGTLWAIAPLSGDEAVSEPGRFIAQPDFVILAPPDIRFSDRFTLELVAEATSRDTVTAYRLSARSVQCALGAGLAPEDILAFLDRGATSPPQNVTETVRGWGERARAVELDERVLLRCSAPDVLDQVLAEGEIATGVLERLSPTVAVVRCDREAAVRAALWRAGYSCRGRATEAKGAIFAAPLSLRQPLAAFDAAPENGSRPSRVLDPAQLLAWDAAER